MICDCGALTVLPVTFIYFVISVNQMIDLIRIDCFVEVLLEEESQFHGHCNHDRTQQHEEQTQGATDQLKVVFLREQVRLDQDLVRKQINGLALGLHVLYVQMLHTKFYII
jgi:hypothetical protein